jgi:FkbM family methyltransferase
MQARFRTYYELDLLEELRRRLGSDRRGMVVDVGAHVGNHSVYFALAGWDVMALEPHPGSQMLLSINAVANDVGSKITTVGMAAGADPRRVGLSDAPDTNTGMCAVQGDGPRCSVPLDALARWPVDLIKIDAERSEADVLRGAVETLRRDSPVLAIEAQTAEDLDRQAAVIEPLGYQPSDRSWCATPVYIWERNP